MNKSSFLDFLGEYHHSVSPFGLIFLLFGIFVFWLLFMGNKDRYINLILGILWCYNGVVLFTMYASSLAPITYALQGILFPLQGVLFFLHVKNLEYKYAKIKTSYLGLFMMFFALFIYPILGNIFGIHYPKAPIFPEPCPLTIFTLGMFLLLQKIPIKIFIIPFIWSLFGLVAVFKLGIYEDIFEVVFGIVTLFVLVWQKRFGSNF